MLIFAYPEVFCLLILLPIVVGLYILARYKRRKNLEIFGNPNILASLMPEVSKYKAPIKLVFQLLIVALLIVVIARPWGGIKDQKTEKQGIEVVIAMDVSNSMLASSTGENNGTSRLRTAKLMLEKLINQLDNDRVGLIVYAGQAYNLLPVTSDFVSAKTFLNSINTDMVSVQGTAIADAIYVAINSFTDKKEIGKSLIIITDAEDLEGDAIEAAKEALKEALKGEDIEAIKAKQEDLQKELFAVSEKIYKAANPQGDPNAAGPETAGNADPNVYEADYTDVDDK